MNPPIGRRRWAIAEGYILGRSNGPAPQLASHEAARILNASDEEAHVEITVYFSERGPAGPYRLAVVPVVVQHARLDSRQAENALLSTIAFAGDE